MCRRVASAKPIKTDKFHIRPGFKRERAQRNRQWTRPLPSIDRWTTRRWVKRRCRNWVKQRSEPRSAHKYLKQHGIRFGERCAFSWPFQYGVELMATAINALTAAEIKRRKAALEAKLRELLGPI